MIFRTGTWTVEQFLRSQGRKTVSMRLLDVPDDAGPEEVRVFEEISRLLRTSNGTYRTTYPHRFKDLNAAAAIQIRRFFAPDAEFQVEDRAASNCLTSAEWAETLLPEFKNISITASDLLLFLMEAQHASGEIFILEPGGEPLQSIRPPFVLSLGVGESRWDIVNRVLASRSRRKLAGLKKEAFRRIPFTHPRARALARADHRFRIEEASVFDAKPNTCQVLRTMNILNRSYFSEERLREGIRAALVSLTENGIWIVGRTVEETSAGNHATIFLKRNQGFEVLDRIGSGWELESWAL